MSKNTISVHTKDGAYTVVVGSSLERELAAAIKREGERRVALITDARVAALIGRRLLKRLARLGVKAELFTFPAGEKHKNQQTATKLIHAMLGRRFGRDSLVVALGGGVVGDTAGYVAATYMRGVPLIHVPTTLLAMVDSSIGGKVGIDTPLGKNTVGAFYHPRAVIDDVQYLEKLPRREVQNGLFESLKKFLAGDREALRLIDELDPDDPRRSPHALLEIVHRSVRFKSGVAARDEREGNERKVLNFGHTIAHALELRSGYRMPHGFAVGYGLLVESKISELLGILSQHDFEVVAGYLRRFGITPKGLRKTDVGAVIAATYGDKKARRGVPHYVLLRSIGSVYTKGGQFAHPVPDKIVRKAFDALQWS